MQWNAGTACVSECMLKTLACRGLRVGPSKVLSGARGPPQFLKTRSENAWANEIFHVGSDQFRESLRELL